MKKYHFLNKSILDGLFEVKKASGSASHDTNEMFKLCEQTLEKGYVYLVYSITSKSTGNFDVINAKMYGTHCDVHTEMVRGTGGSGGGVTCMAIVNNVQDNASIGTFTYAYNKNIVYGANLYVCKIGVDLSQ